jgi:hypothetical protein
LETALGDDMDSRFQSFGQDMRNDLYTPIMNRMNNMQQGLHHDMEALSDQFSTLSTQEQYQQIHDSQQSLESSLSSLSSMFTNFSSHFIKSTQDLRSSHRHLLLKMMKIDAKGGEELEEVGDSI